MAASKARHMINEAVKARDVALAELREIREALSRKHIAVYFLLKQLVPFLNGSRDRDTLNDIIRRAEEMGIVVPHINLERHMRYFFHQVVPETKPIDVEDLFCMTLHTIGANWFLNNSICGIVPSADLLIRWINE